MPVTPPLEHHHFCSVQGGGWLVPVDVDAPAPRTSGIPSSSISYCTLRMRSGTPRNYLLTVCGVREAGTSVQELPRTLPERSIWGGWWVAPV